MEAARREGDAYMTEHGLDAEEFPELPKAPPQKPKSRKGKQKAKVTEANAKIPGTAPPPDPHRETTAGPIPAPSTVPEQDRGHIEIKQTRMKPMFATVTAAAIGQHKTQGAFLKAKKQSQKKVQVQLRPGAT